MSSKIFSPNLLPRLFKEDLCFSSMKISVVRIIFFSIVLLLILLAMGGFLVFKMNQEKKFLEASLSAEKYGDKLTELEKSNSYSRESRVSANKLEKFFDKQYRFSNFLEELIKITPRGLVVNSLETLMDKPGSIKIIGVAKEREGLLKFKENLENSDFCEKVESPLSNYVEPTNLNFEITVKLKNWQPTWGENISKTATPAKEKIEEQP